MKIYISQYDSIKNSFYGGGGARSSHQIAKFLSKKHKVVMICGAYKNSNNEIIDKVFYKYIGFKWAGPKLGQFIYSLILPFYALKEDFDMWLENFQAPHSTGFIPIFTKKPVIGITTILHAEDFSKKYKFPFHLIEKIGIKTYRHIIVSSLNLENKIRKFNKKANIKLIPPGIEKNLFRIKSQKGSHVLFIGRIDIYQKGIDLLLSIWSEVIKEQNIKLVIAGSGNPEEIKTVKQLIKKRGLGNHVVLKGRVDGKAKEDLLANTVLGLSSSRFESFGIVALEYMAAGKPFVCFDIEGFKWIPNSRSLKVWPFDTAIFAKKIIDLLKNQKLREEIGEKGKTFAKNFDLDHVNRKIEFYISKVGRTYGI